MRDPACATARARRAIVVAGADHGLAGQRRIGHHGDVTGRSSRCRRRSRGPCRRRHRVQPHRLHAARRSSSARRRARRRSRRPGRRAAPAGAGVAPPRQRRAGRRRAPRRPTARSAVAGRPRQRRERRVPVDQHAGVHPADPVGQLVEQPAEVARVVHGEQAGAGQRVEPGQRPGELPDVPDVHAAPARAGSSRRPAAAATRPAPRPPPAARPLGLRRPVRERGRPAGATRRAAAPRRGTGRSRAGRRRAVTRPIAGADPPQLRHPRDRRAR